MNERLIRAIQEEIEQAIEDGNHGYAEELTYDLDEMCFARECEQEEDLLG